jgi:transglutaminase-like putative cysteine protease
MFDRADVSALDPSRVDWERVCHCTYLVHQRFNYEYPDRIYDLRHQLMVLPPATFGDQQRPTYSLRVSEPAEVTTRLDSFGNTVLDVRIPFVERSLDFDARITIERRGPPAPRVLDGSWLTDPRLIAATARTTPDRAIEEVAGELAATGEQGLALAELVNTKVHRTMEYVRGVTDVHTTAAAALAVGGGVCQDYSQVMIAICRVLGLPTLYVSGHQLGEGGTHSWVEVLLPAADGSERAEGWAFDPTHGCRVDLTYLTVAVGSDYGDVAPTSGTYRAGHGGSLAGRKEVLVTNVTYTD